MCDCYADLVFASNAGHVLRRSPATVRYYANTGRLAAVRTSDGTRLFRIEDVRKLAEELKTGERTTPAEATTPAK